jgi:hypothetical protein
MNSHTIVNTIVENIKPKLVFCIYGDREFKSEDDITQLLSIHLTLQDALDAYSRVEASLSKYNIFEVYMNESFNPYKCWRYSFTKDDPKILVRYKGYDCMVTKYKYEMLCDPKYLNHYNIELDKSFKWTMDEKFKSMRHQAKYEYKLDQFKDNMNDEYMGLNYEESALTFEEIKIKLKHQAEIEGKRDNIKIEDIQQTVQEIIDANDPSKKVVNEQLSQLLEEEEE